MRFSNHTAVDADKLVDILSTPHNEDDKKLVITFKMHAHDTYKRDPETLQTARRRANNTIKGRRVDTLVTEAVRVASTSIYFGRREKPDPVVEAIEDVWNTKKNSITPEEMAGKIRAICEARRREMEDTTMGEYVHIE